MPGRSRCRGNVNFRILFLRNAGVYRSDRPSARNVLDPAVQAYYRCTSQCVQCAVSKLLQLQGNNCTTVQEQSYHVIVSEHPVSLSHPSEMLPVR